VCVLVVDLMIPVIEHYIAMTTWMTVSGDMGRTLTVVVLTWFKVLSQQLFGGTTEKQVISQIFLSVFWTWFDISVSLARPQIYFQKLTRTMVPNQPPVQWVPCHSRA
jgi:hypothetical protein